jgi:hypothetical protein
MEGNWENIQLAAADSRQGVVLQLGGWKQVSLLQIVHKMLHVPYIDKTMNAAQKKKIYIYIYMCV